MGVIGIDISSKTQASSSPSPDTEFLDEVETSQRYINILQEKGVDKIVLLTHYMYSNDIAMAKQLSGVDVIVGGDSHSLLADSELHREIGLVLRKGNTQQSFKMQMVTMFVLFKLGKMRCYWAS
ncbi:5'-nucleotidase [Vibrio ishigakensis]|uniref:5'-nucleotidase n=1 Tax=Vibrio ishigakensis TaxID=1481914 RepID=A0A0B8PD32_9VIBR|nr:5'-nucleotidase [Vibrio ishigakensis]